MVRSKLSWVGLGLLSLGAVLCAGSTPQSLAERSAASGQDLPPGQRIRKSLRAGEAHEYRLPLAPGEVVDLDAEQNGVDLSLSFVSPGGKILLAVDTPQGTRGIERLVAFAEEGGVYRLRVQGAAGLRGSYLLRRARPRLAGPEDRVRARAWREYSLGDALRWTNPREAKLHYDNALRLWQRLGDRDQQLIAFYRVAGLWRSGHHWPQAIASYERALALADGSWWRLSILDILTVLYRDLGDTEHAFRLGEQAIEIAPRIGDPALHAAALNNLGTIYRRWGDAEKAQRYFTESLRQWRRTEPCIEMVRTLTNQAEILLVLGNPKPVLRSVKESLQVLEEIGQPGGDGTPDRLLALAFHQMGSSRVAIRLLVEARQRARAARMPNIEGQVLNDLGSTLLDLGELAPARDAFLQAARITKASKDLENEAFASAGLGKVLLEQGQAKKAIEVLKSGERLYEQLGDPNGLAQVLYSRALSERKLGSVDAALHSINRALRLVEELRDGVGQSDLRSYVIGPRADLYDLKVDLLLRLHAQQPDKGFDAEAFDASEWRRSRSLLEMLEEMKVGLPRDLPAEALQRQTRLRIKLQRLAEEKLKVDSEAPAARSLAAIEREIQETVAQWEALSEEMRRQSPAYATVTAPKLVGVREVQALLDAETALVAYTVGEERSILWWIEKDALEVHQDLPSEETLKDLASRTYNLLSGPQKKRQTPAQKNLDALGDHLLGPIERRLPRVRRIAVVADEALQILPFSALTVPGSRQPLVNTHAVVQLPSASLAAALRAREEGRVRPPDRIAIFGDPVFDTFDQRVPPSEKTGSPAPDGPPRLLESAREAKAIRKLAPGKSRLFLDFAANREAALHGGLEGARYVHFAAHGVVDLDNPDLSGIQLSRVDPQGRPLDGDGILRFYEIYNLHLPADLVTLSACRTAVGQAVWGEGQLGLSRSFLYAGSSRVIGTLWDVDDGDAADLMTLFYQALLRDGKSPALALQDAQKKMRERADKRAPYHWAGFVLQGDWR